MLALLTRWIWTIATPAKTAPVAAITFSNSETNALNYLMGTSRYIQQWGKIEVTDQMYQEYAETRAKFLRTIWALRPQSILQEEGRQEHPEVLMGILWRGYSRLSNDLEQHKSRFVRIDAARLGDHGDDVPRIHRRRQAQGFVAVGQTSMQKLSVPTQAQN